MSILSDSHELVCNCNFPFGHLLSIIFPLGHSDRDLTINQILLRDYKEKCHSSGAGDASGGGAVVATAAAMQSLPEEEGGKDQEDAELAGLLAAIEEENSR